MAPTDSGSLFAGDPCKWHRGYKVLPRLLVQAPSRGALSHRRTSTGPTLRRRRLRRHRLGIRHVCRQPSRRVHAVQLRHHGRLPASGVCEVIVRAEDDPHDLAKPRGKQDWQLEPHSIWYPRTTGIWQTVWLEEVPTTRIARLAFTPNLARWEIGVEAWMARRIRRDPLRLSVSLQDTRHRCSRPTPTWWLPARCIGASPCRIRASTTRATSCCGARTRPNLIDVQIELWGERGELLDRVLSYTALRSASVQGDRFVLNGRPYLLRMVLDQGYWPESGLTAPDDDALRATSSSRSRWASTACASTRRSRTHATSTGPTTSDSRVWEEMPSAYRFTPDSVERLTREWTEAMARDYSHPCIVAWVPFNESWGVPNLPDNPRERHYVQALYHLTKTLDPTRPVIGNDGWESVATDIIGIHDYDDQPERIAKRYRADEVLPRLFKRERPGGRLLVLEGQHARRPAADAHRVRRHRARRASAGTWGYTRAGTPDEFARRYRELLERRSRSAAALRVLLHPVRRHLSGGERPALCRSHAEDPDRADCCGDGRPRRHARRWSSIS